MFCWCTRTGQPCDRLNKEKLTSRVKHGPQQSVPEGMFDDSIKLVVWGHEHDCRIMPEKVEGKDYYITQPGSSVATSLAPGEALPK
jgi:double-strand break repair protein MRE11